MAGCLRSSSWNLLGGCGREAKTADQGHRTPGNPPSSLRNNAVVNKPPYFPMYPKDFLADDLVLAMTTEGVGAYTRLLCAAWVATPPASIPTNDDALARIAGVTSERWSVLKLEVLAPWVASGDRLVQPRLLRLYEEAVSKIRVNKQNGRKGGRPATPPPEPDKTERLSVGLPAANPSPPKSESESDLEVKANATTLPPQKPAEPKPAPKPRKPHWSEPHGKRLSSLAGAGGGVYAFLNKLAREHTEAAVLAALAISEGVALANWKHAVGWLTETAKRKKQAAPEPIYEDRLD
jgi:uncharacterized protein YdaU (DUF1376 family)